MSISACATAIIADFGRMSAAGRAAFEADMERTVTSLLYNVRKHRGVGALQRGLGPVRRAPHCGEDLRKSGFYAEPSTPPAAGTISTAATSAAATSTTKVSDAPRSGGTRAGAHRVRRLQLPHGRVTWRRIRCSATACTRTRRHERGGGGALSPGGAACRAART